MREGRVVLAFSSSFSEEGVVYDESREVCETQG